MLRLKLHHMFSCVTYFDTPSTAIFRFVCSESCNEACIGGRIGRENTEWKSNISETVTVNNDTITHTRVRACVDSRA